MIRIGVDFGGTKIEVAALSAAGEFLSRLRAPNPGAYDAAIETVRGLIDRTEAAVGRAASVGLGVPGSVNPATGRIRNANSTYLNGRDFTADLSAALSRPVRLANDANCLALSEAVDGAAAGAKVAFAIIIGTGCGGGLVVDGKLVEGANGIGGEWGHMPLPWPGPDEVPGPACWCGQSGCVETWVSGTGLRRDHAATTGHDQPGEWIIEAARTGDPGAVAALDRYIHRLGRSIAVISNIVDPDVFVLGGGMSNVAELYERLVPVIRAHVFCDGWRARIAPARWGDSSGVRGAARLWQS